MFQYTVAGGKSVKPLCVALGWLRTLGTAHRGDDGRTRTHDRPPASSRSSQGIPPDKIRSVTAVKVGSSARTNRVLDTPSGTGSAVG